MLDRLKDLVSADPAWSTHAAAMDKRRCISRRPSRSRSTCWRKAQISTARDIDHESTPAQWMASERQDVARYLV